MGLRTSLVLLIGAIGGLVGVMALVSGMFDSLLPANRLLGATICSLLAIWTSLYLAQAWSKRS